METGLAVEEADPILIRHSDKDTVKQKIMENNKNHFQLMESTPPMNELLLSNLGFLSDTDAARRILNGTYICPEGVDAYTKNFITSLQITTPIDPTDFIPNTVLLQDYQAHWKQSKECCMLMMEIAPQWHVHLLNPRLAWSTKHRRGPLAGMVV